MNDENEVCTSRSSELVHENIMLYVVVCLYICLCVPSMAVYKHMHVSIGLSEFGLYLQGLFNTGDGE